MSEFEDWEPEMDFDPFQAFTSQLTRSMMWDMIGPYMMRDDPMRFGQNPASMDVLEAEARDMWERKHSLMPLGLELPILCSIAAEAVSSAILNGDDDLKDMTEEDRMKFRFSNMKIGTAVTAAVISHMLQRGLITYGEHNVILGE